MKGTEKPKVSAQTPHVDIQDYRPVKDVHKSDKTEEIPVHETQESEDTSRKEFQESQTKEKSSAEDKPPFSFKELFKELNLPYDEDNDTQEKEESEEEGDAEGSYSAKHTDTSQEPSTTEIYFSYEKFYNNEREKSTEVGDDDHTNEDAKLIRITDEEFKYGDKDFFKPFFENSRDISSHEYYYNDNDKKGSRKREVGKHEEFLGKKLTLRMKDKKHKLPSYPRILSNTRKRKEAKKSNLKKTL